MPTPNKVELVTGSATGIGRACAIRFAEKGLAVAVNYSRSQKEAEDTLAEVKKHNVPAILCKANVADEGAVKEMIARCQSELGGLDVLVNNAGIAGPTGKVEEIRPEDWDRCIAVDLNAMFYVTRKAMPLIKAAGGGSIINLSSIAGRFGFALRTPYSAAKWAVVGFTQSLALEAGPEGVRVNCIQPGIVEGERVDRIIADKARALGVSAAQVREKMVEGSALRTTVTAQDIANTALFLASDAGRHISGQSIPVCGGVRYLV
jgi:NAD(P)-dependent dehydrogenase (short-subunit alcohol dehydrogenase family)